MGSKKERNFIKRLQDQAFLIFKETGQYSWHSFTVTRAFFPFIGLLAGREPVTVEQLSTVLDKLFETLYHHPLTRHSKSLTRFLRDKKILPNEQSTENLIRYVVDQVLLRSPVKVPEIVVNEFWTFFDDLFSEPELKGMAELNLDITRIILRCYEPFMVDLINLLKETRRLNASKMKDLTGRMRIIREDFAIIRRQIRALRYIKPFFQTDPKDFKTQARIVASMVREFGPFFIKMAQVAAANADFLPAEIARELRVFQEDVPPMTALEVTAAFEECMGRKPHECYFEFDIDKPIKSGSIGSVYLAKKPISRNGREELKPVIVKIGRNGLDREFMLGRTVLGVAIISSHYWAPHSKLAPFLAAVGQERARVLEMIAVHDLAEDAFGRNGRAIRRDHERDLALRHHGDGHLGEAILPAPVTEMEAGRERVGLVAGLAVERHQPPRRQRPRAKAFHHDPDLAFLNEHRAEHERPQQQQNERNDAERDQPGREQVCGHSHGEVRCHNPTPDVIAPGAPR